MDASHSPFFTIKARTLRLVYSRTSWFASFLSSSESRFHGFAAFTLLPRSPRLHWRSTSKPTSCKTHIGGLTGPSVRHFTPEIPYFSERHQQVPYATAPLPRSAIRDPRRPTRAANYRNDRINLGKLLKFLDFSFCVSAPLSLWRRTPEKHRHCHSFAPELYRNELRDSDGRQQSENQFPFNALFWAYAMAANVMQKNNLLS